MGGLLHLVQRSRRRLGAQAAVPNATAHPSTASVPITGLLYNGPFLCGFNARIKRLTAITARTLRLNEYNQSSVTVTDVALV